MPRIGGLQRCVNLMPPSSPAPHAADQATPPPETRWYLSGHIAYFLAMGIQGVLVPWLVAIVLKETPERVGIAQMVSMLPMLVLIMPGGATADRVELRAHLIRLQIFAALPSLALAIAILMGELSYWVVLAFVLAIRSEDLVFRMVSFAWSGLSAAFGPALLATLWWGRTTGSAVLAAMIGGTITVIVWRWMGWDVWLTERVSGVVVATVLLIGISLLHGRRPTKRSAN